MVASAAFAEFLREQLAPVGHITMRRMFGKTGVFCDGVMLGMVTENTLYVRVDDQNRATFKEAESFPPLNYEKKGLHYRSILLASAGAADRRAQRARDLGAGAAGGSAPRCGEESADCAKGKKHCDRRDVARALLGYPVPRCPANHLNWRRIPLT
jgi:TfoX/Sxy family transcriptional regulator of competence genes